MFAKLSSFVISFGFVQCKSNNSMFIKYVRDHFTTMSIYVDVIISAANVIKSKLDDEFKIKDLGNLKYFLGLEIDRSAQKFSVCQIKYALDVVENFGMLGVRSVKFPMEKNIMLNQYDGGPLIDLIVYRRLVGKHI